MFIDFFYLLRESGVPVSPTAFLRLQSALARGLITSLDDFYTAARSILIKSERLFDTYDRVFAHYFRGRELETGQEIELSPTMQAMLQEWLKDPESLAEALDLDEETVKGMDPQELLEYFRQRLQEQTEAHQGGNHWIGTGGTSPVGHSGYYPGGMRVGGMSRSQSAVKVAMDRRYKEYSDEGPLTQAQVGEALKRLRNLVPAGPKDVVNVDETIRRTMQNAGEIEIVFERSLRDRLKVILAIDNGGWSMDPYVELVQILFRYARYQFKDVKTLYFHNTIYDYLWEDPRRLKKPYKVDDLARLDPETRLIIVGDASMAPYELMVPDGSIYVEEKSGQPSLERLRFIAETLPYSVWLNPKMAGHWPYTQTIAAIRSIFPMFELSLDGLEQAVDYLKGNGRGS
jgi:uncharacterized protein with von Willebrand factor type A (vWA) domain